MRMNFEVRDPALGDLNKSGEKLRKIRKIQAFLTTTLWKIKKGQKRKWQPRTGENDWKIEKRIKNAGKAVISLEKIRESVKNCDAKISYFRKENRKKGAA